MSTFDRLHNDVLVEVTIVVGASYLLFWLVEVTNRTAPIPTSCEPPPLLSTINEWHSLVVLLWVSVTMRASAVLASYILHLIILHPASLGR